MAEEKKGQDEAPKADQALDASVAEKGKSPDVSKEAAEQAIPTTKEEQFVPKTQFDSVKGDVSTKAKQIAALEAQFKQLQDHNAVTERIIESELPDVIKKKLKEDLKAGRVSPDSFDMVANNYTEIYSSGTEVARQSQIEEIANKPETATSVDLVSQLENATSKEELDKLALELLGQ